MTGLLLILCMTFLTPIGWIGLICLGECVSKIIEAKNIDYHDRAKRDILSNLGRIDLDEESLNKVRKFINGRW